MSPSTSSVNRANARVAPLLNVRLFLELTERMMNRPPHLPGLAVFYGFSGLGKSQSAINGANRSNAAIVECGRSWNALTLVDAILYELTNTRMKAPVATKVALIIDALAADSRPLIIDEADYLVKKSIIDLVREMSDKSGAAVILIGEEMMPLKLKAFERTHNRVLHWQRAEPCDVDDAVKLARLYLPHLDIDPKLLAQIVDVTDGVTRRVATCLESIREFAAQRNLKTVTARDWGDTTIYNGTPEPRLRRAGRSA